MAFDKLGFAIVTDAAIATHAKAEFGKLVLFK